MPGKEHKGDQPGVIGAEFAYFFNAFGTEVTVVEMIAKRAPCRGYRNQSTSEWQYTAHDSPSTVLGILQILIWEVVCSETNVNPSEALWFD